MTIRYAALTRQGRRVSGRLDGPTLAEAPDLLARQGLVLLDAAEIPVKTRRVSRTQLATVFLSLSTYVAAGIHLEQALALTGSADSAGDLVARVRRRLQDGSTLHDAFGPEGSVPTVILALLEAAGTGGVVLALQDAAAQLESDVAMRATLREALAYPFVLLGTGGVAISVLLIAVLPRFVAMLTGMNSELPMLTKVLVEISSVWSSFWWQLCLAALIAAVGAVVASRSLAGQRVLLSVPGVGPIIRDLASARAVATLGRMLGVGAPVMSALSAAATASAHAIISRGLRAASVDIENGADLGDALARHSGLTPSLVAVLRVGEKTGKVASLAGRSSMLVAEQARRQIKGLTGLIEPAVVIVLGAVVGIVALGMLQGLYGLRAV